MHTCSSRPQLTWVSAWSYEERLPHTGEEPLLTQVNISTDSSLFLHPSIYSEGPSPVSYWWHTTAQGVLAEFPFGSTNTHSAARKTTAQLCTLCFSISILTSRGQHSRSELFREKHLFQGFSLYLGTRLSPKSSQGGDTQHCKKTCLSRLAGGVSLWKSCTGPQGKFLILPQVPW